MMFMAKFGTFKLKLIATINLAALMSILNLASSTTNYWIKCHDHESQSHHYAGLWRSCPNRGPCVWKNGIVEYAHSLWSFFVRFFITMGTMFNVLVVLFFFMAFVYKLNKKSKVVIRLLESGNLLMVISFGVIFFGFLLFISNSCNVSIWFLGLFLIINFVSSNMLTRIFCAMYFQSTLLNKQSTSFVDTATGAKAAIVDEEKIALTAINNGDDKETVLQMAGAEENNKSETTTSGATN